MKLILFTIFINFIPYVHRVRNKSKMVMSIRLFIWFFIPILEDQSRWVDFKIWCAFYVSTGHSTLVVIHYFFAISNDNVAYGYSFKMETTRVGLTKCGNHGNQLIIAIMKGIKQVDNMGVVIVISHSNECGQKRRFLNFKNVQIFG